MCHIVSVAHIKSLIIPIHSSSVAVCTPYSSAPLSPIYVLSITIRRGTLHCNWPKIIAQNTLKGSEANGSVLQGQTKSDYQLLLATLDGMAVSDCYRVRLFDR